VKLGVASNFVKSPRISTVGYAIRNTQECSGLSPPILGSFMLTSYIDETPRRLLKAPSGPRTHSKRLGLLNPEKHCGFEGGNIEGYAEARRA
jgi:hypothetical protein